MALVDSNVLIDYLTEDPVWWPWTEQVLSKLTNEDKLAINPIIYAELASAYRNEEELEAALPESEFVRLDLPYAAAYLAGQCFVRYRRSGGQKRSPLPDFYIGAHAMVGKYTLVTRDPARYRTYFPDLQLLAP